MHIFLYGPSGSGKSTVGSLLAENLAIDFVDLDVEIEQEIGQSILTYMNENGQAAFRALESTKLADVVRGRDAVVSLGGGALLGEENRILAAANGKVVFLEVELPELVERLAQDANQRPLLAGQLETSLKTLLKEREAHYASFPLRVSAGRDPQEVAWDIQRLLGRYHLCSMPPAYDALVQEGGLDDLGRLLEECELRGPLMVVSDEHVAPLYMQRVLASLKGAGYQAHELVIPAGETHKNIETIMSIWQACLHADLDRKSTIIALGGGVVGDMAGFAAATFMRGCRWVGVPTTLLSMVDASLGGKTGIDLPEGKNLAGAFYPPRMVLADPQVLATLPARELRAGLAEVVKHGVIADPQLFAACAEGWQAVVEKMPKIVRRAMAVKVKVIEEDPFEQGLRMALNLGHTVGHAIERTSDFSLLHGEAVGLGMLVEARLAEQLGIAEPGLASELAQVLGGLGLPLEVPQELPHDQIVAAMQMDKKKAAGKVRFALPVKIGEVRTGVEIDDLPKVMEECL